MGVAETALDTHTHTHTHKSETVLGVDNAKSGICYNWRASVARETLTGVKMKSHCIISKEGKLREYWEKDED